MRKVLQRKQSILFIKILSNLWSQIFIKRQRIKITIFLYLSGIGGSACEPGHKTQTFGQTSCRGTLLWVSYVRRVIFIRVSYTKTKTCWYLSNPKGIKVKYIAYRYRLSAREGTKNVMSDACQWALLGYVRFIKVKFKGYRFQQRGDSY